MIPKTDLAQIQKMNISPEALEAQLERFKKGFSPLRISRPATIGDGIVRFNDEQLKRVIGLYNREIAEGLSPVKFVPASGAATRMFKALYQYLQHPEDVNALDPEHPIKELITQLPAFAFFDVLKTRLPKVNLNSLEERKSHAREIVKAILEEEGLNYGSLPKGLLLFHKYPEGARTSVMEHLVEGVEYARDKGGTVQIHFTVSTEHLQLFKDELNANEPLLSQKSGANFRVSFSSQKPHTDTVAVLPNNEPFRDEEGKLLFRPGGHGSLIENLNELEAGLIFIKNIDNVVRAHLLPQTISYKKALAGLALDIRNHVHAFLIRLEQGAGESLINEIRSYLKQALFTDIPGHLADETIEEQANYLIGYLNRPIRVCGMVKNEGEPGGGPFWVRNSEGQEALQIVESSQVDMENEQQSHLFASSTHFNPVDIVCIVEDFKGAKFNLTRFTDPETGFISEKSVGGKTIKALERPGLWNGAMANWLTLFVEVPAVTFNPVKTVNDLLRPGHQLPK